MATSAHTPSRQVEGVTSRRYCPREATWPPCPYQPVSLCLRQAASCVIQCRAESYSMGAVSGSARGGKSISRAGRAVHHLVGLWGARSQPGL